MRLFLAFFVAFSATALWSRPASAQDLISVEPRVPEGFPRRLRTKLVKQASKRLAATGMPVRSGADIAVAARAAADCADAACLQERLGATGARAAVRLVLAEAEGGFSVSLEVTSLRSGVSLAHEEAGCEGCTADAATEVALSLIDGVQIPENDPEPAPPEPPPAVVEPPPEVPPEAVHIEPPPREGHVPPMAWGTLGLGALLVAGSIPLFLMDGDPTCDGPSQSCPDVYDTRLAGIGLLIGGGAAIVSGIVWAILGLNPPAEPAP